LVRKRLPVSMTCWGKPKFAGPGAPFCGIGDEAEGTRSSKVRVFELSRLSTAFGALLLAVSIGDRSVSARLPWRLLNRQESLSSIPFLIQGTCGRELAHVPDLSISELESRRHIVWSPPPAMIVSGLKSAARPTTPSRYDAAGRNALTNSPDPPP